MNRIAKLSNEKRKEMAEYYQEILKPLGLETHKKSSELTKALNINSRMLRKHIENIMHLYMWNYMDKMIIGTTKGYLYTGDTELINKFLKVKEHQFKSLAYNCYNLKKAIQHRYNYTIDEFLNDTLCE